MYVIKMKTLIYYFAVIAITLASLGVIKLYSPSAPVSGTAVEQTDDAFLTGSKKVELPILMYHSVTKNANSSNNYIISTAQFEDDLKYLKEKGYTTILMADLINYVNGNGDLPEKPVLLTFDDGYYNNYLYAFPLLEKYDSKAVLSIIGYYTDLYSKTPDENPGYAHVTWNNINEMIKSGRMEVQNHSYNLHTTDKGRNGTKKKSGESDAQYRATLMSDIGKLQDQFKANTGTTPSTFTYPFGSVSNASFPIIKEMGFKATLSCESGMNKISRDPECLYMLKRYLRTPKKSAASILK